MAQCIKTELTREDLRQAQKIMLYIMKRIHAVCVEHNIKYWLDYGTLLGAIRHDGFIPWDDDMDICMMREDYEKFCKIAPEALGEEFFLQTKDTDPAFWPEMGKVRLNDTVWLERGWAAVPLLNKGFFVDIFPIESFPESKLYATYLTAKIKLCNTLLLYKINHFSTPKKFKKFITITLSALIPQKFLIDYLNKTVRKLKKSKNKTSMVSKIFDTSISNWTDQDILDKVILKKFEDTEFFIPEKYDIRLKQIFGDYMKLPPENKRYGHHNVVSFSFGNYEF